MTTATRRGHGLVAPEQRRERVQVAGRARPTSSPSGGDASTRSAKQVLDQSVELLVAHGQRRHLVKASS